MHLILTIVLKGYFAYSHNMSSVHVPCVRVSDCVLGYGGRRLGIGQRIVTSINSISGSLIPSPCLFAPDSRYQSNLNDIDKSEHKSLEEGSKGYDWKPEKNKINGCKWNGDSLLIGIFFSLSYFPFFDKYGH